MLASLNLNVKASNGKDVVLVYPDYCKEFENYTDTSSKQLGTVITQGARPIVFLSRKMTEMQQCYSVTKIELPAIVETLKDYKGMQWGQRITVYTNHNILIHDALGLTSDYVYGGDYNLRSMVPKSCTSKASIILLPMQYLGWTLVRSRMTMLIE